jgi:hypothetical protein
MTNYTLTNRNGGFAIVSAKHYEAWLQSPAQAIQKYDALRAILRKQTHDRGYQYSDFTPRIDE